MSDFTSISLLKTTKKELDRFKKTAGSYEGVISSFLDYFNSTGIKPNETSVNPSSIIKNSSERMVKILKNIENKKIDRLVKMNEYIINKIDNINSQKPIEKSIQKAPNLDNHLTLEESEILSKKLLDYRDKLEYVSAEKSELTKRILELEDNGGNKDFGDDFNNTRDAIKKAIKDINNNTKKVVFGNNEVSISVSILNRNLTTIDNLISNL